MIFWKGPPSQPAKSIIPQSVGWSQTNDFALESMIFCTGTATPQRETTHCKSRAQDPHSTLNYRPWATYLLSLVFSACQTGNNTLSLFYLSKTSYLPASKTGSSKTRLCCFRCLQQSSLWILFMDLSGEQYFFPSVLSASDDKVQFSQLYYNSFLKSE